METLSAAQKQQIESLPSTSPRAFESILVLISAFSNSYLHLQQQGGRKREFCF